VCQQGLLGGSPGRHLQVLLQNVFDSPHQNIGETISSCFTSRVVLNRNLETTSQPVHFLGVQLLRRPDRFIGGGGCSSSGSNFRDRSTL
jgi:hypothetical protein